MGVIYKLRPEVRDFIIAQKKANPAISCRGLTTLVGQKFQFHISKSSINHIFKQSGLSLPVGRRSKTKKPKTQPLLPKETPLPKLISAPAPEKPKEIPSLPLPALDRGVLPPPTTLPEKPTVEMQPSPTAQEETTVAETFQELMPKISTQKDAGISPVDITVLAFAEFQPREEPESKITEIPLAAAEITPAQTLEQLRTQETSQPAQGVVSPPSPKPPPATPPEITKAPEEKKEIALPVEPTIKEEPPVKPLEELVSQLPSQQQPALESVKPAPEIPSAAGETTCTGAILFKVVDHLLGGILSITDRMKVRIDKTDADLDAKIAAAIYSDAFSLPEELRFFAGKTVSPQESAEFLRNLGSNKVVSWDILRSVLNSLDEVRSIKINISDGGAVFLDGQFHTVWTTTQIPHDFNNTLHSTKYYINKYFYEKSPLLLLMATGSDAVPREFFTFLLALDCNTKSITRLSLYGNEAEELAIDSIEQPKKKQYLFGLWPWQFIQQRKVKKIAEFNTSVLPFSHKEILAAECEIELLEPNLKQSILLRGCAVKNNPQDKIRVLVVGNLSPGALKIQDIINCYFSRWPYPEDAYQCFSRKIEMFAYTAGSQHILLQNELNIDRKQTAIDLRLLFDNYIKSTDLFIKRYLLPSEYQNKDFSFMREQFYSLATKIKMYADHSEVVFYPQAGYRMVSDLNYMCRRLNEREISLADTKRLWFSVQA